MLAKSNVGKLLPLILSLHTKQIKPLRLNLCIVLSLRKRVKRKGGFIYRCCFQNEPSIVILPVNTSLGIRHLSIYLETGDKDCLTWEWIPTLFFIASNYIRSLKWVWIYCYVTLLLRAVYFFFFFLTYKSWFLLFTLTSKHKRPECSGFSASFSDVSLRQNLVGFRSELLELFGCSL